MSIDVKLAARNAVCTLGKRIIEDPFDVDVRGALLRLYRENPEMFTKSDAVLDAVEAQLAAADAPACGAPGPTCACPHCVADAAVKRVRPDGDWCAYYQLPAWATAGTMVRGCLHTFALKNWVPIADVAAVVELHPVVRVFPPCAPDHVDDAMRYGWLRDKVTLPGLFDALVATFTPALPLPFVRPAYAGVTFNSIDDARDAMGYVIAQTARASKGLPPLPKPPVVGFGLVADPVPNEPAPPQNRPLSPANNFILHGRAATTVTERVDTIKRINARAGERKPDRAEVEAAVAAVTDYIESALRELDEVTINVMRVRTTLRKSTERGVIERDLGGESRSVRSVVQFRPASDDHVSFYLSIHVYGFFEFGVLRIMVYISDRKPTEVQSAHAAVCALLDAIAERQLFVL